MPHPIWTKDQVKNVDFVHFEPFTIGDLFANVFIKCLRFTFDVTSGYKSLFPWQQKNRPLSEKLWLNRIIFLENIAAVPGFVGAMHRHLNSLRNMQKDYGCVHTLLEEAENERMHLLTFLKVHKPGLLFRYGVIITQFGYVTFFAFMYLLFPRVSHRIVGYLEEEAIKTYTNCIEIINQEGSPISHWKQMPAPSIAKQYFHLPDDASLLDVIYVVRKDEELHRDVNHSLADRQILDRDIFKQEP